MMRGPSQCLRYGLAVLTTVLLCAAYPEALRPAPQGSPPATAGQGSTGQARAAAGKVSTTTRLVQVSVIARDKHGQVVPDLGPEDLRFFDNGEEQKIAAFSKESTETPMTAAPTLPPNTWSNRAGSRDALPVNLTVILFDVLNTHIQDQSYARREIVRFLSQIRPEDRVALYALGGDLRVLHEFTSDGASLLRALSRHPGYNGPEVPQPTGTWPTIPPHRDPEAPTADDPLSDFLDGYGHNPVGEQFRTENRARRTMDALEAIGGHVAALPGRKNLLWVSSAFPISFVRETTVPGRTPVYTQAFFEELKRVSLALNDANVAVYPVDARGLTMDLRAITDRGAFPNRPPGAMIRDPGDSSPHPPSLAPDAQVLFTMQDIAARTGGIAFHDTNDLSRAIRTAIDDSRLVYTLAYIPNHNEWNGEFRKIRVESRRPDLRLRYRSGYFALPDAPLTPGQQEHVVAEAKWGLEASEISLTLHAERITVNERAEVQYLLVADPPGIRFSETNGIHAADLMLGLAQKAEDGHILWQESKALGLRLTEDKYESVMSSGLRLAGTKALNPAATRFRFVLLDTATGHVGSVDLPLAQLSAAADRPPIAAPSLPAPPAAQKPER